MKDPPTFSSKLSTFWGKWKNVILGVMCFLIVTSCIIVIVTLVQVFGVKKGKIVLKDDLINR